MAAAASVLDGLEDMFDCPVCMERYEDPRLLTCGHIFCCQCLLDIFNSDYGYDIVCPTCRYRTIEIYSVSSITSLSRPVLLMQIKEKFGAIAAEARRVDQQMERELREAKENLILINATHKDQERELDRKLKAAMDELSVRNDKHAEEKAEFQRKLQLAENRLAVVKGHYTKQQQLLERGLGTATEEVNVIKKKYSELQVQMRELDAANSKLKAELQLKAILDPKDHMRLHLQLKEIVPLIAEMIGDFQQGEKRELKMKFEEANEEISAKNRMIAAYKKSLKLKKEEADQMIRMRIKQQQDCDTKIQKSQRELSTLEETHNNRQRRLEFDLQTSKEMCQQLSRKVAQERDNHRISQQKSEDTAIGFFVTSVLLFFVLCIVILFAYYK